MGAEVLELCAERCNVSRFVTTASEGPVVSHTFDDTLPSGKVVYAQKGSDLSARLPRDSWSAEFLLRTAWYLSTLRQGGLLVHSSGVAFGVRAVVAIGQSGAGKSTLARLCVAGGAQLLSDEMVQLLPGGPSAWGTPFRSDFRGPGAPGGQRIATLLVLHQALEERMTPVALSEVVSTLMSQLYVLPGHPGTDQSELRRRLLAIVDQVSVHRLSFRKDEVVGPFLKSWLEARADH